ncbi:MAG: hypothetical protein FWD12_10520, partial [Alphaproteobacteria bacterium]|nr:hypothetical protein [Alphaproteobacteria bacterium]
VEQRFATTLAQHFAELAHHWESAVEAEKALHYRLRAADLAIRRYANEEALMHADRAERVGEWSHRALDATQSAALAFVRGEAYHGLSRFAEAEQQFKTTLQRRGIGVPATRAHLALSALWQISLQALHRFGIVRRPRATQDRESAKLSAHLHTRFAEHAYFMRDSLGIVHGSVTALNHAESINSYPEIIEGYGALAVGLGTAGIHGLARFYRDRCISVAGRFGALPDQAFAHLLAGVYSYQVGDWEATRTYLTQGVVLCEQTGDHFRRQSCLVVGYFGAIATGDYGDPEAGLRQFGPDAEEIDNAPVRAWVLAGLSVLDMLRGRSPAQTLRRLELTRGASLHRAELLLCDGLEAAALMRNGDVAAAATVAARALDDMKDSTCTMGIAMYSVCAVADVFLALAGSAAPETVQRTEFVASARAACHAVQRFAAKTRICRPRARLLAGRLALLNGRRRAAAERFARALTDASRLDMPLEQAMCHLELAELEVNDVAKRTHLCHGMDIMRRLEADPWRGADPATDAFVRRTLA